MGNSQAQGRPSLGFWTWSIFFRRLPLGHFPVNGNNVPGEADLFQRPNGNPGDVHFPPLVAVCGCTGLSVMIVVPAFAVADDSDEDVVAAVLIGVVVAASPQRLPRVSHRGGWPNAN